THTQTHKHLHKHIHIHTYTNVYTHHTTHTHTNTHTHTRARARARSQSIQAIAYINEMSAAQSHTGSTVGFPNPERDDPLRFQFGETLMEHVIQYLHRTQVHQ